MNKDPGVPGGELPRFIRPYQVWITDDVKAKYVI